MAETAAFALRSARAAVALMGSRAVDSLTSETHAFSLQTVRETEAIYP